jgi:hypothetical protein
LFSYAYWKGACPSPSGFISVICHLVIVWGRWIYSLFFLFLFQNVYGLVFCPHRLWIKCWNCVNQQTTVKILSLLMFWVNHFLWIENSIPFVLSSFVPNFIISFSFKIRWCLFKLPRENLGLLWSLRCITWHWCKKARLILLPSIETAIKLSLPAEMVMLIIFKTSKI